jgi:tRNA pseudouridine55 synthase
MEDSIIPIYKPIGLSSFKALAIFKKQNNLKKVGHAGTLDPLAEGLLILATGKATKQITQIQDLPKLYIAKIRLGATTQSFDREFEEENLVSTNHLNRVDIENALKHFEGKIMQTPPAFSAVKINGQRAYKLAREGVEIEIKPREVEIYSIKLLNYQSPEDFDLEIYCSKGTYIRSIARDLGEYLKVGGYMKALTRVSIGSYHIDKALRLNDLDKKPFPASAE